MKKIKYILAILSLLILMIPTSVSAVSIMDNPGYKQPESSGESVTVNPGTGALQVVDDNMFDKADEWMPDWIKNFANGDVASSKTNLFKLANLFYNIFYLASLGFFAFKFAESIYLCYTRSQHSITQNQLQHEVLEPIKGLLYFVIGLTLIKVVVSLIIPTVATLIS